MTKEWEIEERKTSDQTREEVHINKDMQMEMVILSIKGFQLGKVTVKRFDKSQFKPQNAPYLNK